MSDSESLPINTGRSVGQVLRPFIFGGVVLLVLAALFGLPWWALVSASTDWPAPVFAIGTAVFAVAVIAFPVLMYLGHRGGGADWAARIADTMLGVVWVLFTWTLLSNVLRLGLIVAGVDNPVRSRIVAVAIVAVAVPLIIWGAVEAMRVPRLRHVEVTLPRLGAGLDGTRVVVLTDTHYGPINRARWSAGVAAAVNKLDPDIVVHAGDIADGTADKRREQSAPLGTIRAKMARVYVTGNHEYYSEAQGWLDRMGELGWDLLHNRHVVVERGGDRLIVAGIDDATAAGSGLPGHRPNLDGALAGTDASLPVLLVAHQPKQVREAAAAGVDLQISGHTHGGQIWPFNFLVKLDQPSVQGLSRHGERTQLYTSRGTGFWGPPLRVFAPSEITVLTLRTA
ncbi:putative MPP superfamily phosphohydrolase [Allocatelliglobosispora scoriae]|uniref:Putative MPP superfamily phosphohydrolase n=1 Tax=Allocatelliglobosispora scoriae TaxID=643052 RepID=A0A841C0Y7_9ACTN|nr:metallophosphoesterase [Allocatelliglobosispora scoriae]MBB5872630.1 putative MPP superfamily phosphohydrolase [Allocatelliglobosispora scoriae]